MPDNDPIKEIQIRLEKYPDAKSTLTECSIAVEPANKDGFPVEFTVETNGYIVNLGGWHEYFESVDSALNCFAFGLSEMCRLKIISSGRRPYKWTIQSWENGTWVDDSTVGLLFFAFWRKPRISYQQNRLLESVKQTANP